MDVASATKRLASTSEELLSRGWAVVDGCLGTSWAKSLLEEAISLEKGGFLEPHSFEFSAAKDGSRYHFKHPSRAFVDLDSNRVKQGVAAAAPELTRMATTVACEFARSLADALPQLHVCTDCSSVQVKLQLTRGEHGCAPCHYDTSESAATRQLTLLIYLNEAWEDCFGGELQLLPFMSDPVHVSPTFDNAIIFMSDRILHRSLPPRGVGVSRPRWLLTIWFDGAKVDQPLGGRWPPLLQRLLAPAIYKSDFLEALEHSMPHGTGRDALVKAQLEEIHEIEQDEEFAEILEQLREASPSTKLHKRRKIDCVD